MPIAGKQTGVINLSLELRKNISRENGGWRSMRICSGIGNKWLILQERVVSPRENICKTPSQPFCPDVLEPPSVPRIALSL